MARGVNYSGHFRFHPRLGQRANPLAQHIAILLFEELANLASL